MDRIDELVSQLVKHEGLELKPYTDTVGKLTIGVGHNLDDMGISVEIAHLLLKEDIDSATREIKRNFKWFNDLSDTRKNVIVDMVFNMGISRFKRFKKTIAHIEQGEYEKASIEALNSKWADQVGQRALTLSKMLKDG